MSQMSVLRTCVQMTDKATLQQALIAMGQMFPGMTTTMSGNDILVHWVGIQQYRKQNLTFKWNGKLFEPVGDSYNTAGNLSKVMTATQVHYRRVAAKSVMGKYGSCLTSEINQGIRIKIQR